MAPRRILVILLGLIAAIVVVLVAAQLVLPGIAASRIRDRLARDGTVQSVHVRAFPAIKLLWGRADSVTVRIASLRADTTRTGDLLARSGQTRDLDVAIGTLTEGPLVLRNVSVRKRGSGVTGEAGVAESDLQAALPPGFDVQPVASGGGRLLLRAQASLLGLGVAVDALLSARDGALVIQPVNVPFGALATLTVFADPRVAVEGVGARAQAGGFALTAQARLRAR
jgi:hypothetical protein